MKNAATSGCMFRESFGACPVAEGPVEASRAGTFMYTEMFALQYGFARYSPRMPFGRPRLWSFAGDYLESSFDPAWQLAWVFSSCLAPGRLAL